MTITCKLFLRDTSHTVVQPLEYDEFNNTLHIPGWADGYEVVDYVIVDKDKKNLLIYEAWEE